ncbi:VIT family protein [Novosphingobium sp.]|uniref:VIT1/CCC1 transporter family protein n=1 Tax=Novosphingobium sp. TaxID=1874826 RepID=UPI0038BC3718
MARTHKEKHLVERIGWLRAAVLGANDGILSTSSLILGVAIATPERDAILLTGVAGLVAGAMSMAAGEFVSVSSQADTEAADIRRESRELATMPGAEQEELAAIYRKRGLDPQLAEQVAVQMTAKDPLAAHLRDELGLVEHLAANPVQAGLSSAASFAVGAAQPLLVVALVPVAALLWAIPVSSLLFLAGLGAVGAQVGGAPVVKAVLRVVIWGAVAMGITAGIGHLFGTTVA